MSPRDVFGIILRVGGLYLTWAGLWSIVGSTLGALLPYFTNSVSGMQTFNQAANGAVGVMVLLGVLQAIGGLYLLRGAPHVLEYAYGERGDATARAREAAREARAARDVRV